MVPAPPITNIDLFCITAALMFGTGGLPHVIVRFFTVPKVSDARKSAGYALIFIAILFVFIINFIFNNIINEIISIVY